MNEKDVVLEARGVEKSYRDDATAVPVLRGVNLAVHRGETVAILGTSGSGKSTLCTRSADSIRSTRAR